MNGVNNHYNLTLYNMMCTEHVKSNTNVARTPYALFRSPFTRTIYLRYPILSSIGNLLNSLLFFILLLLLSFISVSVVFYCPERHVKTISFNPCTIIIWFIQWSIRIFPIILYVFQCVPIILLYTHINYLKFNLKNNEYSRNM